MTSTVLDQDLPARTKSTREFWREFVKIKSNLISIGFVATISILVILATQLPITSPESPDLSNVLKPPSYTHLFGTDSLGRDVLSRFIYGAEVPLTVGLLSGILMTVLGVGIGVLAGYEGRYVDEAL